MKTKRLLSLALAVALCATLALASGCKGSGNDNTASKKAGEATVEDIYGSSDLSAETIEALQNSGEITLYTDKGDVAKGNYDDDWKETLDWYKQYYGLTINWRYQAYGDDLSKFLVDFAAGDAPDLITLNYRRWPKAGNRQIIYNLDELADKGVLGLDHPEVTKYADLAARFNIGKKKYSVGISYATPTVCAYNVDLFDQYKVKNPGEYYKEGTWNMDTYIKCCKDITRTTSDGTKIWGTYGWCYSWYLVANDCRLVQWDKDYKLKLSMTDSKTVNTLTTIQDIYEKGYCPSSEEGGNDFFKKGQMGMSLMTADNMAQMLKDVTFKWDILPMPYGSDNSSGETAGEVSGWGVVTSSKNLQGAVNYTIAQRLRDMIVNNQSWGVYCCSSYQEVYSKDQIETIVGYCDHIGLDLYMGVGDLNNKQWGFWNDLKRGTMTVKEVFDTYESQWQEQVDAENQQSKR